ncbi:MAG: hypothetical protein LC117_08775 [Bacteroidia bacterium]|nr:hypothetical protein [Bacteroidia bacterium]MCZ2278006.1 hypothetical protein [Bacteroidia bacterium]
MMDLIIAILIALGSLQSADQFTPDFEQQNRDAVNQATMIYERGEYRIREGGTYTGGVVVITGVGV